MRHGDFTGIKGVPAQDVAMWESTGPIADRTQDYLGASDGAVIQFRRQDGGGGPAIGTIEPRIPYVKLASFEGIAPKSANWRELGASAENRPVSQKSPADALASPCA